MTADTDIAAQKFRCGAVHLENIMNQSDAAMMTAMAAFIPLLCVTFTVIEGLPV